MSWEDEEDDEQDLLLIDQLERDALTKRQQAASTNTLWAGSATALAPQQQQQQPPPAAGPPPCHSVPSSRPPEALQEPQGWRAPAQGRRPPLTHLQHAWQQQQHRRPQQPPLPPALAELRRRVDRFRGTFRSLPPPQPQHGSCPGVFNRGCGGKLQWVEGPPDPNTGRPAFGFWGCSRFHAADGCHYREYPPPRRTTPELSIQVAWPHEIEVVPMLGAEDVVAACGGVAGVLAAVGVDMHCAVRDGLGIRGNGEPNASAVAGSEGGRTCTSGAEGGVDELDASVATIWPAKERMDQHCSSDQPHSGPKPLAPDLQELKSAAPSMQQQQQQCVGSAPQQQIKSQWQQPSAQPVQQQRQEQSQQPLLQPLLLPAQPPLQQRREGPRPQAEPPVVFCLEDYEPVRARLLQASQQAGLMLLSQAGTIPPKTLQSARGTLRRAIPPEEVAALYKRMPPWLERALLPFQREGVRFGLERGGRELLADEMGVGKTVQALALASCYSDKWPLLVVAPASCRLQWAEEIERWLPHLRPSQLHVIEGQAGRVSAAAKPLVTITSYEMLQRLTCEACKARHGQPAGMGSKSGPGGPAARHAVPLARPCPRQGCNDPQNCMAGMGWRVIIVDESHVLRTSSHAPDALHTEAVVATAKRASHAIFLSGTPSLSRPFDLYRQVDALCPGLLGADRAAYSTTYCGRRLVPTFGANGSSSGHRWWNNGLTRAGELHGLLKREVMLRRLKKDVMGQLPPKRRQVIRLPKPPPGDWPARPSAKGKAMQQFATPAEADEEEEEEEEEEDSNGESGEGVYMSAAHRTGLAKLPSVVEWVMHALGCARGGQQEAKQQADNVSTPDNGPKMLVFAHHRDVIAGLAAALEGTTGYPHVPYVRIDGSSDAGKQWADRQQAVATFREAPSVRVALLSVSAAGVGLDFSTASTVVFAELPSEVSLVRQAEDRAHRRGQRHAVNVYFLCAKGTTDDRTWQALNRSLARVSAVHDGLPGGSGEGSAGPGGCRTSQAGLEVADVCDVEEQCGCGQRRQQQGPQQQEQGQQEQQAVLAAHSTAVVAVVAANASKCDTESLAAAEAGTRAGELPMAVEAYPEAKAVLGGEATVDPPEEPAVACSEGEPASGADDPSRQQHGQGSKQPSLSEAVQSRATMFAKPETPLAPHPMQEAGSVVTAPTARGGTGDTAVGSSPVADGSADPGPVFFEVSLWTGRVHLHIAADGSAPLQLSLPAEALAVEDSPLLADLVAAVTALCNAAVPTPLVAASAAGGLADGDAAVTAAAVPPSIFVPGIGIVALPAGVTPATLAAWLAEAREFLSEWRELRSVHQLRLAGRVIRAPLDAEVEALVAAASASGALGQGTSRFVEQEGRPDLELPPDVAWREVRVRFARYGSEATYRQPFLPDGSRLCLNCGAHVPGAELVAANIVLEGTFHLFCGGPCEHRYGLKSNGAAYRRALFALERGRCVMCSLDCHNLVKRLQTVERGTPSWQERRRQLIANAAPRFLTRGYTAQLEALVNRAVPGNAWHADHIRAVYEGGGLCDVDNLRTLCVLCHKDHTTAQAKTRAAERRAATAAAAERRDWLEQPADRAGREKLRRRVPRTKRVRIDDDEDG